MATLGLVAAVLLMLAGIAGTVLPALPGLPLVWIGILVYALLAGSERIGTDFLVITLLVTVAAEAGEHYVRAWGARRFGASRAGAWGAVIGAIVGLFFFPVGLVLGPLCGAALAELLIGRTLDEALRAGIGGVLGTLGFMPVKIAVGVGMMIAFFVTVF